MKSLKKSNNDFFVYFFILINFRIMSNNKENSPMQLILIKKPKFFIKILNPRFVIHHLVNGDIGNIVLIKL